MTHLSTRNIKRFIERRIGGRVLEINMSKHAHVLFEYNGHEHKTIFSITPSDLNWEMRRYADIKRELTARGIWVSK